MCCLLEIEIQRIIFLVRDNKVTQLGTSATMISTSGNEKITSGQQKLTVLDSTLKGQTITIKAINKDGEFDKKKDANGIPTNEDDVFTYTIKEDDTIQDVINKINADSGVTVFFDEASKKFSITANNTGKALNGEAAIQLDGDGIALFTDIMQLGNLEASMRSKSSVTLMDDTEILLNNNIKMDSLLNFDGELDSLPQSIILTDKGWNKNYLYI